MLVRRVFRFSQGLEIFIEITAPTTMIVLRVVHQIMYVYASQIVYIIYFAKIFIELLTIIIGKNYFRLRLYIYLYLKYMINVYIN